MNALSNKEDREWEPRIVCRQIIQVFLDLIQWCANSRPELLNSLRTKVKGILFMSSSSLFQLILSSAIRNNSYYMSEQLS
jgi:hypothetical protein